MTAPEQPDDRRAPCGAVEIADRVVVVGGRYSGRPGVLLRTAVLHQGHHLVRLGCGTTARISMAYIRPVDCALAG